MAIFKSGNPAISEKKFTSTVISDVVDMENAMTVRGSLQKFGFLLLLVLGSSFYSWKQFAEGGAVNGMIWTGAIGGRIIAVFLSFDKQWGPFCSPLFDLMGCFFLCVVSSMYNSEFAEKSSNILINDVC